MRHRDDVTEPSVQLFTDDVERDIARINSSRQLPADEEGIGELDWDQYLEVSSSDIPFSSMLGPLSSLLTNRIISQGFDLDDPKGRAEMQPLIGRGLCVQITALYCPVADCSSTPFSFAPQIP